MWSGSVVPNNGDGTNYNVLIDGSNTGTNSNVTLDMGATINTLVIDQSDSLDIGWGQTLLVVGGAISNNATVRVLGQGSLGINGATTLSGSGKVQLTTAIGSAGNLYESYLQGSNSDDVLTNEVGHTISGSGQLGAGLLGLVNKGLIDANDPTASQTLVVRPNSAGVVNTGTMQASNGGILQLGSGTFTNTGGTIQALNGSVVQLADGSIITGGMLASQGSGAFNVVWGNTSTLKETITNNSTVNVLGEGHLLMSGATTLSGSGKVQLTTAIGSAGNLYESYLQGSNSDDVLTNEVGHTISGSGQLGAGLLGLVNKGLIDANDPTASQTLVVRPNSAGVVNTGTMQASNGGILQLGSGTFTNTGGTIQALNGSVVQLADGSIITGGMLASQGSGAFNVVWGNTSTLKETITNNSTVNVLGEGHLLMSGATTLSGSGKVQLTTAIGSAGNLYESYLQGSNSDDVLTNEVGHTISGSGQLGAGLLGLVNKGLIDANDPTASQTLVVRPNSAGVVNTGTMQASNGGILQLGSGTFTNTGGTIQALNGSFVQLADGAVITGGTFASQDDGVFQVVSGSNSTLKETITNNATVKVLHEGHLLMSGATTLSGSGKVQLTTAIGSAGNLYESYLQGSNSDDVLTNEVGHTISGSGQLGAGLLGLVNKGLIDANDPTASQTLVVRPNSAGVVNTGTMQASNGGILQLGSGTFTNTGGTIQALNGSVVQLADGSIITGGTFASQDDGVFQVVSGSNSTLKETITNNATVKVLHDGHLLINGAATLTGSDKVQMTSGRGSVGTLYESYLEGSSSGDVLTNDTGHTISGAGQLGVGTLGLVNKGLIDANDNTADNALTVRPSSVGVINTGTMQASNGGILSLTGGTFNNTGTVAALNGSNVTFASDAVVPSISSTGSLTSGTWKAVDTGAGATIAVNSGTASTIDTIGADATVELSGANSAFTVNGTVIDSSLTTNQGTLRLLEGRAFTTSGSLANEGTIRLGDAVRTAVTTDFSQSDAGVLDFDIFGTGGKGNDYGQLHVVGNASLFGEIVVEFQDYSPTIGDSWKLITTTDGMLTTNGLATSLLGLASGVHVDEVFADHYYQLTITAVPEPSVLAMLIALGSAGVFSYLRRGPRCVRQVCSITCLSGVICCVLTVFSVVPARAASIQWLGHPIGAGTSKATGVSADGTVVVGENYSPYVGPSLTSYSTPFYWTATGGMTDLGVLAGYSAGAGATGVSADGSVIVGNGTSPSSFGTSSEAFRSAQTDGMVGLGYLPGGIPSRSSASAVSGDGSVVVGSSDAANYTTYAYRWTSAGGMMNLGFLQNGVMGPRSEAYAISGDGGTIVGTSSAGYYTVSVPNPFGGTEMYSSGTIMEAFRRTESGGMVGLGHAASNSAYSCAFGISADGSVVVGSSNLVDSEYSQVGMEAFRWTDGEGMVSLGDLPGGSVYSQANAASANGSVIVGHGTSASGQEAFFWDASHGLRSLKDMLVNDYGLAFTSGQALTNATAISADGMTIVGYGKSGAGDEAWVVTIPEPSALAMLIALGGAGVLGYSRRRPRA